MGNKCFRPSIENNQPIYVASLNNALIEANKVYMQKRQQKQAIIQQIIKNENRRGHLKKLFDHLISHKKNILPSIKYCNKKTSQEQSLPNIVIGNMFCQKLVKMISARKIKQSDLQRQQTRTKKLTTTMNYIGDQFEFRNLIHELESHFFALVILILKYNKQKKVENYISGTLIEYSKACQEKITAWKELRNILDLYLTMVFERNIQMINKSCYIPFYAYSSLLSKSRTQLFSAQFVQKHFNFILKLFFQLQESINSSKSLSGTEQFMQFSQCVKNIVKQFILISSQNKKIKYHILTQIMYEQDLQRFQVVKTRKLQRIIEQNLNPSDREHFMFDWLAYLIRYVGKRNGPQLECVRDSVKQSYQEVPVHSEIMIATLKNITSLESRVNAVKTLRRWFDEQLLNTDKTLEYFSQRIFEALLVNLYTPNLYNQELNNQSRQLLAYILQKKPRKISQILCLLNKQLRKTKIQTFSPENNSTGRFHTFPRMALPIIQQEMMSTLWDDDLSSIIKLSDGQFDIKLEFEQVQKLYAPIPKLSVHPHNTIYLIELVAVSSNYVDTQNEDIQSQIYNFLISLTNSMKVPNEQIQTIYLQKLIKKLNFLFTQLYKKIQFMLYVFLKHNFRHVEKQNGQIWVQVLVVIVVINIVIQERIVRPTKRVKRLNQVLNQILAIMKSQNNEQEIYMVYQNNKSLLDYSGIIAQHQEQKKLKIFQKNKPKLNEAYGKSITDGQNSAVSSFLQVSISNPDSDFKRIMEMVLNP